MSKNGNKNLTNSLLYSMNFHSVFIIRSSFYIYYFGTIRNFSNVSQLIRLKW